MTSDGRKTNLRSEENRKQTIEMHDTHVVRRVLAAVRTLLALNATIRSQTRVQFNNQNSDMS